MSDPSDLARAVGNAHAQTARPHVNLNNSVDIITGLNTQLEELVNQLTNHQNGAIGVQNNPMLSEPSVAPPVSTNSMANLNDEISRLSLSINVLEAISSRYLTEL